MATVEYWIQLENHPWDVAPNNIDRMTGQNMQDREPGYLSPITVGGKPMYRLLSRAVDTAGGEIPLIAIPPHPPDPNKQVRTADEALILRRYTANWAAPDDRKVNPWDLNEPDATTTNGTIPGPVIECNVGDIVVVHFRNMDNRIKLMLRPAPGPIPIPIPTPVAFPITKRIHSLHPHGFVFGSTSDGAYPLSPPDPSQPVAAEAAAWAQVPGFSGQFKQGDRVPPGGTYTYTWNTLGWPTTAGVWLYHDHAICDEENVNHGAIGIIVIHNIADQLQEVDIRAGDAQNPSKLDPAFLPGGTANGSPRELRCFPFPVPIPLHPGQLNLVRRSAAPHGGHGGGMPGMPMATEPTPEPLSPPGAAPMLVDGEGYLELDPKMEQILRLCRWFYRPPPSKALYLLLFHELGDAGMCINGRKYMGNTPTLVAGPTSRLRFGVVGMGDDFHTFHIHGHRWVIPGPDGTDPAAIQTSVQKRAVSQFEDTKIFGPANSFVFTIKEGNLDVGGLPSFMGPPIGAAIGEWHLHCHVLNHMMMGMMGSLLIIAGGELALPLPVGVPCDMGAMGPPPPGPTVVVRNNSFNPNSLTVSAGTTVTFDFQGSPHTVKTVATTGGATPITINNGGGDLDAVPQGQQRIVMIMGNPGGQIQYQCGIHGPAMAGTINIA
jgi:FtsP/CotA-like multicopper oxidase with cupredoxin domain/plastocyanin